MRVKTSRAARGLRVLAGIPLVLGAVAGCAVNPVTGAPQLALITEGQEIELGRQTAAAVEASIGLVPDEGLQQYIEQIGRPMALASERPNLPWQFRVVDDPTPNAFAVPGGFIYFTRGLLALMGSEAQLATVMGHEIAHVTARHSVTQISRAQLAQIGLGVGGLLLPGLQQLEPLAGASLQLLFLRYGRDAERQADDLGFRYALEQGYDVREMAWVFQSLQRFGEAAGASPLPSWLSSHPAPADRIQFVERRFAELAPAAQGGRIGTTDYLNRIDGLVFGENPRNGFFRANEFLHPDLRFALTFPQGWNTQNLAQQVTAVSPQQDAVLQLTLVPVTDPLAAAQRFAQQQGVRAGPAQRQTIGGQPGVLLAFDAQTQQTNVRGLAGFIGYRDRVYQILSYTPTPQFPRYEPAFRQTIGSFREVTDPQVLNIQPNRIRVVRLPRAMTLTEFNQTQPSTIPLEQLVILNQAPDATTILPGGTMIKRVVAGQ